MLVRDTGIEPVDPLKSREDACLNASPRRQFARCPGVTRVSQLPATSAAARWTVMNVSSEVTAIRGLRWTPANAPNRRCHNSIQSVTGSLQRGVLGVRVQPHCQTGVLVPDPRRDHRHRNPLQVHQSRASVPSGVQFDVPHPGSLGRVAPIAREYCRAVRSADLVAHDVLPRARRQHRAPTPPARRSRSRTEARHQPIRQRQRAPRSGRLRIVLHSLAARASPGCSRWSASRPSRSTSDHRSPGNLAPPQT